MCIDRRHFMKAGAGVLAAAAIPGPNVLALGGLNGGKRGAHRVIVLNVSGGWDTLSAIVPHGLTEYYNRRPTIAVPAPNPSDPTAALAAETGIGISPLMPEIHAAYQAGELAIVQKTGYPTPNLSHFTSQDVMSRGVRDLTHTDTRGWLGRLGDLYFNQTIEITGVGTGNKLDFVGNTFRPVVFDTLDSLTIPIDSGQTLDSVYRNQKTEEILGDAGALTGLKAIVRSATTSAFQLTDQVTNAIANYTTTAVYPNTSLGRSMQDVARIVFGNLGSQILYVQTGGLDTHASQQNTLNARFPDISGSLGALIADLKAMNEYDNSTIVVISEFGRRNFENGGLGTDHGHGVNFLVFGGQVAGGIKGPNVTNSEMLQDYLPMVTDFRQVYSEIISTRLGLDPTPVFPGYTPPATPVGLFV